MGKHPFKNRTFFLDYLQGSMRKASRERKDKYFEYNTGVPKMYLVETYDERIPFEKQYELLKRYLIEFLKIEEFIEIQKGEFVQVVIKYNNELLDFFIDFNIFYPERRFYCIFSLLPSSKSDQVISKIINSIPILDNFWMDNSILGITEDSMGKKYRIESYKNPKYKSSFESQTNDPSQQIFSNDINKKLISNFPIYCNHFFQRNHEEYTNLDMYYTGKIVFLGGELEFVLEKASQVQKLYSQELKMLEKHLINSEFGRKQKPSKIKELAEPVEINLNHVQNVPEIGDYITNGSSPFRIFGDAFEQGDEYFYSYAFDKHIGSAIGIEIFSTLIRLYLYDDTCTNSIKRFLRNVQNYIEPSAYIVRSNDE
jgi:hypothetical protein